jgi:hypothetical protein
MSNLDNQLPQLVKFKWPKMCDYQYFYNKLQKVPLFLINSNVFIKKKTFLLNKYIC